MVRRWIGSADVEIGEHGEQVVAHRSAAVATTETINVTSDGQLALAANPDRISAVLVNDGDTWMDMIASRNLTSHTYDEGTASRISARILGSYCGEFKSLRAAMERLKETPPS